MPALARGLLGAHVAERADDVAGERDAAVVLNPREAEVGDPELALQVEQQVRRLHVAVDDAVVVGVLQGFGRFFAEPGDAAEELAAANRLVAREDGAAAVDGDRARRAVHRAADAGRALRRRDAAHGPQLVDGGLHRLAVDVLHRVVVDAVLLADGEHGDDVRMVELGGGLRFVAEAGDLPLIEHGGEGQDLQRDAAIERHLVGLVDDAHAAAADLADDLVVADLLGGRFFAGPCR